jgi:predicted adenine nucleotide alpha hydrolase (AANH) superfamily ATPase
VPRLKEYGYVVAMYFANSNIDTRAEYDKRLAEARKLAEAEGVSLVAEEYDHGEWLRKVAAGHEDDPEKGARCERCYRYNLAKTAAYLDAHGGDVFCTSLTVSPHKPSVKIFASSEDARFLKEDFKKREGFKLSVKRAAELGLYRQSYCGCEFSKARQVERDAART